MTRLRALAAKPPARPAPFRSSGEPLDSATRALSESRFHHDFSRVRVHTGPEANAAAASLQARAFTTDGHIAFAAGAFAPGTSAGRELLLHELTHVVQQESGVSGDVGRPDDAHETEARAVANRVASGGTAQVHQQLQPAPRVQLQPAQKEDPKLELLAAELKKLIDDKTKREQINGSMAHAIAKAYLNRPRARPSLHATTYADDRAPQPDPEPTENEVYTALVGAIEISSITSDAARWTWRPHMDPNEGRRGDVVTEIAKWGLEQAKDLAIDKLKDTAITCVANWLGVGGLWVVVKAVSGGDVVTSSKRGAKGSDVSGSLETVISVAELVKTLMKPAKRPLYKYEQILSDVKNWMAGEQKKAEAEALAKTLAMQRMMRPLAPPDALRVDTGRH